MKGLKGCLMAVAILGGVAQTQNLQQQWQVEPEFYYENRRTGQQVYYSPTIYAELDPVTNNYREYRYNQAYGKDYQWKNYNGGIYSERIFTARYNQLTYYTDKNDDFTDWGYNVGLAAGIAGGCCILICIGTITAQCVVRRRKRMKELKAQKDLAELEGMEMAEVSSSIKSDTDDPDGKDPDSKKQKKKSTSEKRAEALAKKAGESKGTVLADISDDEHSRREMMGRSDQFSVQPPIQDYERTSEKKTVGRGRFDINHADNNIPGENEEGGGFF